ncbi:MAG: methyltransferase domain-containing protein [Deltaproteobacteria bacterium]|nr:methyltransferase domain-containing protein [Deltaproteobacteria bacterium]
MGKPHYLWKQLYELAAPNDILQRDCSGFSFPAGLSKQLYKTFSVFNEELSAEQLNFADDYWGIGVSKSKADIIFIIDSILSNSSIHGLESIKEYFYGVYLPNIRDNISSIGSFQCASDEAVIPLAKFLCLQATKQSKSPLLTTRSFAKPVYVNLGCGNNFHSDWLNFDFSSHHPDVSQVNLRSGIPLPDNHADVVYHSHLLEHFTKDEAPQFIAECYRILKPGGLLRVAVPDLETIAKLYLLNMEKSLDGDLVAEDRYDWMMIEMYDQTVRNRSGGAMLDWWVQPQMRSGDFIIERLGDEAKGVIHALHNSITLPSPLPEPTEPLEIGRFRLSGEVHQWMYDRFSLARLLRHAGFRDIRRVGADESQIPGFSRFGLDTDVNSTTRKPDSLFVEAIK